MAVTILEALQNAKINFDGRTQFQHVLAKQQLHNAVTLLEKGYGINDEVEPLLEDHGAVENVPDKK